MKWRLGSGLALVAGIELIAVGFKYLVQILVARLAGADQYGLFVYATTWASTLAIPAGLGLSAIVIRYVPQYSATDAREHLGALIRFTRRWTRFSSFAVASAAALLVVLIVPSRQERIGLLLAFALLPLLCTTTLQSETLRGSGHVIYARVIPNLVQPAIILGAAVTWYLVLDSFTAVDALASMAIGLVCTGVLQAVAIEHALEVRGPGRLEPPKREWWGLGRQLLMIKFGQMVLNNSDVLLVGILVGPTSAGVYAAALKTATVAGIVTQAVNLAVPPEVARLFSVGDRRGVELIVRRSARFAFMPSLLAALVLAVFAAPILSVFGQAFREGAFALVILAGARLVTAWTGPVGSILNVTGHQAVSFRVYSLAALIQVILLLVLIPMFDLVGAAIAYTLAMVFWNVVLSWSVMHLLSIRLWPLPVKKDQ